MRTLLFVSLLGGSLLAAGAAGAQDPVPRTTTPASVPADEASGAAEVSADAAPAASTHVFQILDGQVVLDGIAIPNAVPDGLDLAGRSTEALEYSGGISPVIEVDGQAYVFEAGRLVSIEASRRPNAGRFMLDDIVPEPLALDAAPTQELTLVGQELYMRDVATQDRGLWEKLHLERVLETDAVQLAERVRATPAGSDRTALRDDLRALLSRLLTLKQELRREEMTRAQAEIDALRTQLDARDERHDAIVEGRLRALVGE